MQGPFPFGVACVAVDTKALLFQFWDMPFLWLKLPYFGARYRRQIIAFMLEHHPWTRDYAWIAVRLGDGWPKRG